MDAKDAGEPITISESDLITPTHLSRISETAEELNILVDPEKQIWVTEGVPVKDLNVPTPEIVWPDKPHVFMAHDLIVTDRNHKNVELKDVVVIMAHGRRDDNTWVFRNGQDVAETVNAYNLRAEKNDAPKIEFVLSCNVENNPDPSGIKIKDISEQHIAQSVGEIVSLGTRHFSKYVRVEMSVKVDGEFWGLDDLITFRGTEILPDVDQTAPK